MTGVLGSNYAHVISLDDDPDRFAIYFESQFAFPVLNASVV